MILYLSLKLYMYLFAFNCRFWSGKGTAFILKKISAYLDQKLNAVTQKIMANEPFQSARKNTFIFKFLSFCHAHNLQLPSTTAEEAEASKRMYFTYFPRKKYIY